MPAFINMASPDMWDISTKWSGYQDEKHQVPKVDAMPLFSRLWKRNTSGRDGHTVLVSLDVNTWRWRGIQTPQDLLGILYYLDCILKIPVEWSYENIATAFLMSQVKNQEWLRRSTVNLKAELTGAARDLKWLNPRIHPVIGQHIICYDVNSAYLSAFNGGALGVGDPTHRTENIDERLPGIYHASINIAASLFDGNQLPQIFGKSEWLTHDLLAFAREAGYEIEVDECWQWDEHHRVVGTAASALWNAREVLHAERGDNQRFPNKLCRQNAYESIKRIALPLPGRFNNVHTPVFRPDWWQCGVGRARATQLRRLMKLYQQSHIPAWIYGDSLYFLSSDSNPQTAVPGMLDRSTKLGGYKCNGVIEVTDEVLEVWKTNSFAKLTTMFSRIAKVPMTGE
jgi:hypothetical protein